MDGIWLPAQSDDCQRPLCVPIFCVTLHDQGQTVKECPGNTHSSVPMIQCSKALSAHCLQSNTVSPHALQACCVHETRRVSSRSTDLVRKAQDCDSLCQASAVSCPPGHSLASFMGLKPGLPRQLLMAGACIGILDPPVQKGHATV